MKKYSINEEAGTGIESGCTKITIIEDENGKTLEELCKADIETRRTLAENGYCLDILKDDKNVMVRCDVIDAGYDPNYFTNDSHPYIIRKLIQMGIINDISGSVHENDKFVKKELMLKQALGSNLRDTTKITLFNDVAYIINELCKDPYVPSKSALVSMLVEEGLRAHGYNVKGHMSDLIGVNI